MNIAVIGYYYRHNLGDDTYVNVMTKYLPEHRLTFICSDDLKNYSMEQYNGIIVGGGDIINEYYYKTIWPILEKFKGFKIALSIGIPFASLISKKYFKIFDHVFVRNYEHVRDVQKVIGTYKAHYMPDLAFCLDFPPKQNNDSIVAKAKTPSCGIFMIQNLMKFPLVVKDIIKLIYEINRKYNIILYLFNTHNSGENDIYASNYIKDKIHSKIKRSKGNHYDITVDSNRYTPEEMLLKISKLDFAVCMRYHSHIFCMLANVPFISISSTHKTRSLMDQNKLSDYQYKIVLDAYHTPISSSYAEMDKIYKYSQEHLVSFKEQLSKVVSKNKFLLDHKQVSNTINILSNSDPHVLVSKCLENYNDPDTAARLMSRLVIGYPDSDYVWGIKEKIDNIADSISFLLGVEKYKNKRFYKSILPINFDLAEYQSYKTAHRGGWYLAIEKLAKMSDKKGILCDMYVDRTFHWCKTYAMCMGTIPYTMPWCGFIHHTTNTSNSTYNIIEMFKTKEFLQSLPMCIGLFTLSNKSTVEVTKLLRDINSDVKVWTLTHPIDKPNIMYDDPTSKLRILGSSIRSNKVAQKTNLIQIGCWLRNYWTIHTVKTNIQKFVLVGKHMQNCCIPDNFKIELINHKAPGHSGHPKPPKPPGPPGHPGHPCRPEINTTSLWIKYFIEWLENDHRIKDIILSNNTVYVDLKDNSRGKSFLEEINALIDSTKTIQYMDNNEYDELLSKNIVFLHLIDAAAVNTIIECVVRNTPILVNKIPGVVEILGDWYPMYYDQTHIQNNTIGKVLSSQNIKLAHKYLSKMDKTRFKMSSFIDSFSTIINKELGV